jgi:hypothetical protein
VDSSVFALVDPIAYGQLTNADLPLDVTLMVIGKWGAVRHIIMGLGSGFPRTWCLLYSGGDLRTSGPTHLKFPICSRCLSSPYAELAKDR